MKQTYEQRVRSLAEKMAEAIPNWQSLPIGMQKIRAEDFLPAARIAVEEMAEVAEKIFTGSYQDESLADILKWNGLIPDNGQEAETK